MTPRLGGRALVWAAILVILAVMGAPMPSHAALATLRHKIGLAAAHQQDDGPSSPLDQKLGAMIDSTDAIHGLQQQVSSVTQSVDSFLTAHAGDASTVAVDREQIEHILSTLSRLSASQKEIEERNQRQIEQDHANLMQLIDTQKKQQALITQELAHTKSLEQQLAAMKQGQEQTLNQHMAAQELESVSIEHDQVRQQLEQQEQQDLQDEASMDGSFLEFSAQRPSSHLQVNERMRHWAESDQEMDAAHLGEHSLGMAAAQHSTSRTDPRRYSSSSDYLAAMNSADDAETMSPQQLQAFGEQMDGGGEHEVGTPIASRGLHSMSEIDSLVAEGAQEHQTPSFQFNPSQLHNPALKSSLGSLQDEDSIQLAMMRTAAKIKAIAAELERHQNANGGDRSAGIEIDMESFGTDEVHY